MTSNVLYMCNKKTQNKTDVLTLFDFRVFLHSGFLLLTLLVFLCTLYKSAHLSLVERSTHVNVVFITFDKEEISVKIRSLITDG